jgi:hypothetical protein
MSPKRAPIETIERCGHLPPFPKLSRMFQDFENSLTERFQRIERRCSEGHCISSLMCEKKKDGGPWAKKFNLNLKT